MGVEAVVIYSMATLSNDGRSVCKNCILTYDKKEITIEVSNGPLIAVISFPWLLTLTRVGV